MVVLRDNRSTCPDCRIGQRCCTDVGVYLTLVASPSTAAAIALHMSTSMPDHSPLSFANEKPGSPKWTPHSRLPRALIASRVGLGCSCCAPHGTPVSATAATPKSVVLMLIFESPH